MMVTMFQALLLTSCLGAFLGVVLLLLKPLTQKHFSAAWNYYIWLVVFLVMVLPLSMQTQEDLGISEGTVEQAEAFVGETEELSLTKALTGEEITPAQPEILTDDAGHRLVSASLQEIRAREWNIVKWLRLTKRLAPVWAGVAVTLLALRVIGYGAFLWKIARSTRKIDCPELAAYTRRKVRVRTGDWVASPLLVGVIRPILLLPHWELTREQLGNILAHETTHLKRNDMLYKWFLVLVKSIHWFNPIVYVVGRQVNQACEISCDLAVTGPMSTAEKKSYVETILALFTEHHSMDYALTMGMGGSKSLLKKRFVRMKNFSAVGAGIRRFSNVGAVLLLVGALLVSGGLAVKANSAGAFGVAVSSQSGFPYMMECEKCETQTLFSNRVVVGSIQGIRKFYYYVYLYQCPGCSHDWSERAAIESEYILQMSNGGKTSQSYRVETAPKVVDQEAEEALEAARIVLSEEADNAQEAIEIIRKVIKNSRENE